MESRGTAYGSVDVLITHTRNANLLAPEPASNIMQEVKTTLKELSSQQMVECVKIVMKTEQARRTYWVAQHIVIHHVVEMAAFHHVLQSTLSLAKIDILDSKIEQEIILELDEEDVGCNEHAILAHLGHFLGLITIARNRPIFARDLDLEMLLEKAMQRSFYFDSIVPFIQQILKSCKTSSVFSISSAWIRNLLFKLADAHGSSLAGKYIKRDIESLFTILGVSLPAVQSERLNSFEPMVARFGITRPRHILEIRADDQSNNADKASTPVSEVESVDPTGKANDDTSSQRTQQDSLYGEDNLPTTSRSRAPSTSSSDFSFSLNPDFPMDEELEFAPSPFDDIEPPHVSYNKLDISSMEDLCRHVYVSPLLNMNLPAKEIKYIIECALKHAVREVIECVVKKAKNQTLHFVDESIRKDFHAKKKFDKQAVREASLKMAKSMAGGLAYGISSLPLSRMMEGYLQHNLFGETSLEDVPGGDQIRDGNAKIGACFIAKTASEATAVEINKRFDDERYNPTLHNFEQNTDGRHSAVCRPTGENLSAYTGYANVHIGFDDYENENDGAAALAASQQPPTVKFIYLEDEKTMFDQLTNLLNTIDSWFGENDAQIVLAGIRSAEVVANIRLIVYNLIVDLQQPRKGPACVPESVIYYAVDQFLMHYTPEPKGEAEVKWSKHLRDVFIELCRIIIAQITGTELVRRITQFVCENSTKNRFNVDAVAFLVRMQLIHSAVFDKHLKTLLHRGDRTATFTFVSDLVKAVYATYDDPNMQFTLLPHTIDAIQSAYDSKVTPPGSQH
uniref:HDOD domain-containing protein n=1 Tax=Steinernema glaseri TaxID=37863 RepID=A0A1I8ASM6_9BILA